MARSVFITGASAGIGEGLALEFARRGCNLAIAARRTERLEALASRLAACGAARVLPITMDVTDADSIRRGLEHAARDLGRLDILIVNAGVGYTLPIGRDRFAKAAEVLATNLTGAIATIEHGLPILRAQGGGQVVVITSVAGRRGQPFLGAYCAAKAGLRAYVESLRAEVWHEPIVVTELAPGYIDTDMNRGAPRRPFVIPVEKGTAIMARLIERKVGRRYVPAWPWALVAPFLGMMPTRLLAPRPRTR